MPDQESQTPQADDNSAIRSLREQMKKLEAEAKESARAREAAESKLRERELAEMNEMDRLKAELAEAKAKAGIAEQLARKVESSDAFFTQNYEQKLAEAPAEYREYVATLSANGSPVDRLNALEAAMKLIPKPVTQLGVPTSPSSPGFVQPTHTPPPPRDPKDWGGIDFVGAVRDAATTGRFEDPATRYKAPDAK